MHVEGEVSFVVKENKRGVNDLPGFIGLGSFAFLVQITFVIHLENVRLNISSHLPHLWKIFDKCGVLNFLSLGLAGPQL